MDETTLRTQFHATGVAAGLSAGNHRYAQTRADGISDAHSLFADMLHTQQALVTMQDARPTIEDENSPSLAFVDSLWKTDASDSTAVPGEASRFVHTLLSAASAAAKRLGTQTSAVISVAALETGWGQHVIKMPTGHSSHNLFGIKATSSEQSNAVEALTTEFVDGSALKMREAFRAYDSPAESVADFAEFILTNPRYHKALNQAEDPRTFIEQISLAGYATDPDYAEKVKSVLLQVETILAKPQSLAFDQVAPFPVSQ